MDQSDLRTALEIAESRMPEMLADSEGWQTLDVIYEPPHVERLWRPLIIDGESYRLYLHCIHACDPGQALFHPHPWPSAVKIVAGGYEMAVGYGTGDVPPPIAATLWLAPGTYYEMINPDGWHYVRVPKGTSLSIMLTGTPWSRPSPGKGLKHPSLSVERAEALRQAFKVALNAYPKPY
jgi:hypothetical protein